MRRYFFDAQTQFEIMHSFALRLKHPFDHLVRRGMAVNVDLIGLVILSDY